MRDRQSKQYHGLKTAFNKLAGLTFWVTTGVTAARRGGSFVMTGHRFGVLLRHQFINNCSLRRIPENPSCLPVVSSICGALLVTMDRRDDAA